MSTPQYHSVVVPGDPQGTPRPTRRQAELFSLHSDLMYPHLARLSVAVVGLRDGEPYELGTGTLVGIGDRVLIATAAHVLKPYLPDRFWVLAFDKSEKFRLKVRGTGLRERVDVAWIEVEVPETSESTLWPRASLGDLESGIAHVDDVVAIFGLPVALLKRLQPPDSRYARFGVA